MDRARSCPEPPQNTEVAAFAGPGISCCRADRESPRRGQGRFGSVASSIAGSNEAPDTQATRDRIARWALEQLNGPVANAHRASLGFGTELDQFVSHPRCRLDRYCQSV